MTTTAHEMTEVGKVEADWIEDALSDLGLDLATCPIETLSALRRAWARIADEHGDERRSEIIPESPDDPRSEPSKARGPAPRVRKPSPRRRGQRRGSPPWGVKNRDAEITDKQVSLLLDLVRDYGSALVVNFARDCEPKIMLPRKVALNETHMRRLNRGQASDLIGALLKAQKAGEIEKL